MKLNPVRYIWLRIWGDGSVIAAVIRFPTAPRQVWCSPPLTEARCETLAAFFFFLQFCILFSWAAPISTCLLLFHLTYHPRYLLYPSPSYFFFSFFFILSARSVGVSEEAREQRSGERQRTRAALCHPFVFASQRPARRLDYHVSCFVKERGVALRGLSNTVPFFFFPPPHCGQSWGKIFSRRGKGSSVLWSRVCVCTTVHTLLWEEPPPTCAAFQHLFINFTPL